jgi:hypothetical protein
LKRQNSRTLNKKRINRSAVLLFMGTSALLACAFFLSLHSSSPSSPTTDSQLWELNDIAKLEPVAPSPSDLFAPGVPRVIYPYSVVPGGVRTPEELRESGVHDRVVSEHYAGFDFQKARVIKVKQARLVYLSYRIGDQIYWTTKKVSLHEGEDLITDGKVTARTRCGNQVSVLPQKKTSSQEPAAAQFDGPIGSSTRVPFPDNFHSALESRPGPGWGAPGLGPAGLIAMAGGGSSPLGGGFLPIGSPVAPGSGGKSPSPGAGGGPGGPGSGPGPGPGPGTPPVSVPEPGTLELAFVEFLAIILGLKFVSRRIRLARFHK